MTISFIPAHKAPGFCAGAEDSAVRKDGVRMRAQLRHQAMVVTVGGDIDAATEDRVHEFATRHVTVGNALILDLSGVDFFSAGGITVLIAVDDVCRTAGVPWALVGSRIVNWVLRLTDCDTELPTASSVPDALHQVTDITRVRRRLALVMNTAQRHAG